MIHSHCSIRYIRMSNVKADACDSVMFYFHPGILYWICGTGTENGTRLFLAFSTQFPVHLFQMSFRNRSQLMHIDTQLVVIAST